MNYRFVLRTLGQILLVEAGILLLPLFIAFLYQEQDLYPAFLLPIGLLVILGLTLIKLNQKPSNLMFAKEGFAIVSIGWVLLSLFGAMPYIISGEIPNFFDALFESVSGLTTTGASILQDVEAMSYGLLFWRSFTNWIGGMGILVFVLAIIPNINNRAMLILKAESPGPQVGKLVSKMRFTARILYGIYVGLTILEIILLKIGGMPFFDSVVHALSTAGTGGFSIKNASIGYYQSAYIEIVITIFMLLFATNFNLFYLILIGQSRQVFKNEELRWYLGIVAVAIAIITGSIMRLYDSFAVAFRHASFHVASIISTTGFSTTDYNLWPTMAKMVLIILMLTGACAGSTSGGMKITRIIILFKSIVNEVKHSLNPHHVLSIKLDGRIVDQAVIKGVTNFFIAYMMLIFLGTLVISFDGEDFVTGFTTVISCISNIGPGLNAVGPLGNYAFYSIPSKLFLAILMLAGRLELFPILMLFTPRMWKK